MVATAPVFSGVAGAGTGSIVPQGGVAGTPQVQAPATYTYSPTGKDVFGNPVQGTQTQTYDQASGQAAGQTPTPPKEQTTLSSDKTDQISQSSQTYQNYAKAAQTAGYTTDQSGFAIYGNSGQYAQAPSTSQAITDQTGNTYWQDAQGVRYAIGPSTVQDPVAKQQLDQWNQLKSQFDTTQQGIINDITNQYDRLYQQQQDVNTRASASLGQSLLVSGTARYAPETAIGEAQALSSYGITKLSDLTSQKSAALNQANSAWESGDMQLLGKINDEINKINDNIQKTASDLSSRMLKINQDAQAQQAASQQDQAIADQLSQGITDPNQIMKNLNGKINPATGQPYTLTAKDVNDAINNLNPNAKDVATIQSEAAKFNAPQDVLAAIGKAKTVTEAIQAAAGYLTDPSTDYGQYVQYQNAAKAAGQTPMSYQSFQNTLAYNKAYATSKGTEVGKLASGASGTGLTQSNISSRSDVPAQLRPYVKQSADGTWYMDLSSIGSAQRAGLVSQAGDLPVITDKNQAADLSNIKDVNAKLQTIADVMRNINSPSALSRVLAGPYAQFSSVAQTDPKAAASGALNDAALDILKAISGVQGFRGNQSAIQQIKDSLPKITDTQDTAAQKLDTVAQLISDREQGILGQKGPTDNTSFVIRSEDQAKQAIIDYGNKNPDQQQAITSIMGSKNPDTGEPYSYLEAAQILGIDIPASSGTSDFDMKDFISSHPIF